MSRRQGKPSRDPLARAARVAAEAESGETIVSSTVRDLVAGSGLRFEDRGVRALKGLPEEVHLYHVLG